QRAAACGQMDFKYVRSDRQHAYNNLSLSLLGRHQAANAAVALAAIAELRAAGWQISEAAIREGLQQVRWPARVEVIARDPVVIVDAAHNVASIESLLETLQESFGNQRRILIFATTQEKDCTGMLRLLLPRFEEVVLTRYKNNPRGVPVSELAALGSAVAPKPLHQCGDVASAWSLARSLAGREDLICGTGSFFLAAELGEEMRNSNAAVSVGSQ
ncbi:MAG TPA: cyanophycin synthetase, partial [Burkholderiaceae bacterium]|nr:cyanophycin synthetase [Burkholderiaceae bacterium]